MAILLYSNGITEEFRAKGFVFTENELVNLFDEYKHIKTHRVTAIINTWCVYGDSLDQSNFNKIASDMTGNKIYTHALFIHDSEIDPEWNATDTILYNSYEDFLLLLKNLIDQIAIEILEQFESQDDESKVDFLPFLDTLGIVGTTNNKKILFGFNPNEQSSEFYNDEQFYTFSKKTYEFLRKNRQEKEPFTIYIDKRAVIIVETAYVKEFLSTLLEQFKNKEDYEICNDISRMINDWTKITKPVKTTRKKGKHAGENTNE